MYWRVEWHDGDVLAAPALSTGWGGDRTVARGLSCCRSALALVRYFEPWRMNMEMAETFELEEDDPRYGDWQDDRAEILSRAHRCPTENSRVVVIDGDRIGCGQDGEPLVEPTRVVGEIAYGDLLAHPLLRWLDDVSADDLADVLADDRVAKPAAGATCRAIGACPVWMTGAAARRWNRGETTARDLTECVVPDGAEYLSLGAALKIRTFAEMLDGQFAV